MTIQIIVEKYHNPCRMGGFGYMAHSDDLEAAGIFGFGGTEQEAVNAFGAELEAVKQEEV